MYYNIVLFFVLCPCMAINVSVQYNGGFLSGIILLTQCYYHWGTRLNAIKRFCICSLYSHLNVSIFFPLTGGCSECLDAIIFFIKNYWLDEDPEDLASSGSSRYGIWSPRWFSW